MTTVGSTEAQILEAARQVFMQKGFAAARMCDIAKTANINPALLHYYFRKKEKLFSIIFEQESSNFHSNILSILRSDRPFFEKLQLMVEKEIQKVISTPFMPMFILNEMHSNPERMLHCSETQHRHTELFNAFREVVEQEQTAGRIRPVCPKQLFLSILGLAIFPFLAQPMVELALDIDTVAFNQLVTARIQHAGEMVIRSLEL